MTGKTLWLLRRLSRQVWLRAVIIGLLGVATALLGVLLAPFIPTYLSEIIGADSVDQILSILASSMLAVVTFSIAIAVQAYAAAATNATPRATRLLQGDHTTQNVLSTFIGAFLFSLVGIIVLHTGLYGDRGRVVLFVATVAVVTVVVIALMRWVTHLMRFGRMGDTLRRVEQVASEALHMRARSPFLGGIPRRGPPPADAFPVYPNEVGYVQYVDMHALQRFAEECGVELWLTALPGKFVHPAAALLHVDGGEDLDEIEQLRSRLRNAYSIATERTYDQDPRFGLIVLSEIASRALSPAVNDPGTAIDVLGRLVRVLSLWPGEDQPDSAGECRNRADHSRLHVPPIRTTDLIMDAFQPIARDGAAFIEVQVRLQESLIALADIAPATYTDATRAMSVQARDRALAALSVEPDRVRLTAAMPRP